MGARTADNSDPGALASMLDVDRPAGRLWGEEELAAVLRHQLAAPLASDLGGAATAAAGAAGAPGESSRDRGCPIGTFGELLHHPEPPVQLLALAKDFAKASRADPGAALPKEIAAVLYFAAIIVARRRCGVRITQLSPEEISAGAEWALAQPWVDAATRSLFDLT